MKTLSPRAACAAVIIAFALPAISGCKDDAPSDAAVTAPSPAAAMEFCDAAAPMLVVVPRDFIGTAEHVAQFDTLAAVAPEDLLPDIQLLRRHYDADVTPADPASQDFDNFPGSVQEAALRLSGELADRC